MKNQQLSPKKYIKAKARKLPFGECLINNEWQEYGMAIVLITKTMPSGKNIIGLYMVDVFCLGLKNTLYKFGLNEFETQEFKMDLSSKYEMVPVSVNEAHNIIYGGIDFAEELGFKPHNDFDITEFMLDPDYIDAGIDEIEFGKEGKPLFVAGPNDNINRILNTLELNLGEGNYDFLSPDFS